MKRSIRSVFIFCLAALSATSGHCAEDIFTLEGVVSTISGEPAQDAEVYIYSSSNTRRPADFISPKSGKNGVYRLILPRATYWGVARIKKGERFGPLQPGDKHSGEPVKIEADTDTSVTVDFTVADMQELAQRRGKERGEPLIEISGMITSNGRPVAGAYLYAKSSRINTNLPEFFSGWTDATGKYRLKLPPGSYFLGCDKTFPPADASNNLHEITVTAGELPVAINVQLPLDSTMSVTPASGGYK